MSYSGERDALELHELGPDIGDFAESFAQNSVAPNDRRTIILFPGGMGSALKRGHSTYNGNPLPPGEPFDDLWLTIETYIGRIEDLQMNGDLDYQNKFIIPQGSIELPCGASPYENFTSWCQDKQFDLYVFGYDWRRPPECSVRFFLDQFLPELAQTVGQGLFNDLTLIGHSLGGMTVKLIMQDACSLVQKIKRAITVGTPFYGYAGQTRRYFEGEPDLLFQSKKEQTHILSTLLGGYFLQFLDSDTYDGVAAALESDTSYPLNAYPSMDPLTGQRADPFNPDSTATLLRYPNYVNVDYLKNTAKLTYQKVPQDLPDAVASRFFNIRAVQGSNGVDSNDTYVSQTWSRVPANFDPESDPAPIAYAKGPGDGIIPAWSARLISLDQAFPNNVITLRGDLEHMSLMDSQAVQEQIYKILGSPQ